MAVDNFDRYDLRSKRKSDEPRYIDAIRNLLDLGGQVTGDVYGPISEIVFPDDVTPPSEEDIQAKLTELHADWETKKYARERAIDYASIGDQMDMIYKDNKNSTTTHAAAVEAVKTKWPKDNSGPVE